MIRFLASSLLILLPATVARTQRVLGDDYAPRTVLSEPMRPITNPKITTASKIAKNELIIGVVVGGKARAYPINQLTGPSREIINDVLGGTPIAATW